MPHWPRERMRNTLLATCLALLTIPLSADRGHGEVAVRYGEVVHVRGAALEALHGWRLDRLALLACGQAACQPIPFQIDAPDAAGHWLHDQDAAGIDDDATRVLGNADVLLFMADDAGSRARRTDLPGTSAAEIQIHDPVSASTRWAYLVAFPATAPRSGISYVHYDPKLDRARGARISLGFADGIPNYLAGAPEGAGAEDGPNLLDRLKIRATATFLWGLIHFSRDESGLRADAVAWRQGPIRVVRTQRQWIHIGWGIRSPTFVSSTYFYRDFAEMRVRLRLNFPPTYFFSDIVVRAILDFRDLTRWELLTPSLPRGIPAAATMSQAQALVNDSADTWFALKGPRMTLIQTMDASPSLATVRRRLLYRAGRKGVPPEAVPGEQPGIGFVWDRWEHVAAGTHQLESRSFALPAEVDVRAFMAARHRPLQATVQPPGD
ncbi:MAG: hypothetical protein U0587_13445 [Candidatus Binatia bacterium]